MLEETYKNIESKIGTVAKIDATLCKTLALACVSIKDELAAEMLLKRLRTHIALTDDENSMYDVSYYLSYVEDILDLTKEFEFVPQIKVMRSSVQDIYEKFLYNKMHLVAALSNLERESLMDGLRENYWVN